MHEASTLPSAPIVPLEALAAQCDELRQRYATAAPFPHIVLDDFLPAAVICRVADEFPALDSQTWNHYAHYNERTWQLRDPSQFGPATQALVAELQSPAFCRWLSELTGHPDLIADPQLSRSGLHAASAGGFLNIHADFSVHPEHRHWARRCNLLLYLNDDWQDSFRGHLELWSRDMKAMVQRIAPVLNRCVIFTTDATSYHGYPDPICCPAGTARRLLSLYYFTDETTAPTIRTTDYRARPQDGMRRLPVWLDKQALRAYDFAKRRLGLGDGLAFRLMNWLSRSGRGKK